MIVEQLVPANGEVEVDSVLADLRAGTGLARPFAHASIDFFAEVASRLQTRSTSASMPDLAALAFWMRRSHLVELKSRFEAQDVDGSIRLPRGLVFHLPPGNVDTIFMYSMLLAALCGNENIVRLPRLRSPSMIEMCGALNETVATAGSDRWTPAIAVVGYGHETDITAAFSARADVRVIWGGDATIARIRAIPIPPRAIELTFADRYSIAAVDATAFLDAGEARRARAVEDFVSDTYAFDQGACSSPQLFAWIGGIDDAEAAANLFFPAIADVAGRRGYTPEAGIATAQTLAAATLAADGGVRWSRRFGRELMVVETDVPHELSRTHVGGGYLLSMRLDRLSDIGPLLRRPDQTLTYFGFSEADLRELASRTIETGGLDRIVPFGQALTFDRFWDGHDLLSSFTRIVRVGRGR